jgi:hypothetical protein
MGKVVLFVVTVKHPDNDAIEHRYSRHVSPPHDWGHQKKIVVSEKMFMVTNSLVVPCRGLPPHFATFAQKMENGDP